MILAQINQSKNGIQNQNRIERGIFNWVCVRKGVRLNTAHFSLTFVLYYQENSRTNEKNATVFQPCRWKWKLLSLYVLPQWITHGDTTMQEGLKCYLRTVIRASRNVHHADIAQMYRHKQFGSWACFLPLMWVQQCLLLKTVINHQTYKYEKSPFFAVNTYAIASFKSITVWKQCQEHDKQIWGCAFVK